MTSFQPDSVAFPIRIGDDGRLVRAERTEVLLHVLRAMAGTPARSWPHAPWFGLYEQFSEANLALEDQPRLADLLNEGLKGLGIHWATVSAVTTASASGVDRAREFQITIALSEGGFHHGNLAMASS